MKTIVILISQLDMRIQDPPQMMQSYLDLFYFHQISPLPCLQLTILSYQWFLESKQYDIKPINHPYQDQSKSWSNHDQILKLTILLLCTSFNTINTSIASHTLNENRTRRRHIKHRPQTILTKDNQQTNTTLSSLSNQCFTHHSIINYNQLNHN